MLRSGLVCALAFGIAIAAGSAASAEDEPLFLDGFEQNPADSWFWEGKFPHRTVEFSDVGTWITGGAYEGNGVLQVEGQLFTPNIQVQAHSLYRWSAQVKGTADRATAMLRHEFHADSDWTAHSGFVRATQTREQGFWFGKPGEGRLFLDNVRVEEAQASDYVAWADDLYAGLGQSVTIDTRFRAPNEIPNAVDALRRGRSVRTVMLGDSIMNDTYNSLWDVLAEQHVPEGGDLVTIPSVRGGTGMDWFAETDPSTDEPRINEWVLRHQPDLVMLGGISHQGGSIAESYRDVVRQIKAADPSIEILILSGAAGQFDPTDPGKWQFDVEPGDPSQFRSRLLDVARDEGVGFFDLRSPWNQFLIDADQSREFFLRDDIHMNQYGQQVVARSLEQFFVATPEPGTGTLLMLVGAAALARRRRAAA